MRLVLLFLLPILFLPGCEPPADPIVEPPILDLSTPGRTLESLASVWTGNRDIDNYRRLLSQDYRFYFVPINIDPPPQTGYEIPQYWTFMEDVSATGNMFAQAYDIRLEVLNAADFDDPDIFGESYPANNVQIQFYLWSDGPDSAVLASGPCDFEFRKVGDVWLISSWYDRTGGTEPGQSLGELRYEYR